MRHTSIPALVAAGGLLVFSWSCDVQPGGKASEPPAFNTPAAKLQPEPAMTARQRAPRRLKPIQPLSIKGPKATKAAPLPRAGKVVAIFHSGNVDGELDPCG